MMEPMLNELRQEAETTKRLLDRVPANKLDWRPHPKSMSLGQACAACSLYSRRSQSPHSARAI